MALSSQRHDMHPLTFTLVEDNFGVKFVNKDDVDHLISSIKTKYSLTKIGRATYIAASPSSGITSDERSISQYPDTSKRNYKNMNTSDLEKCKRVHTHLSRRSLARRHRLPSPQMRRHGWMQRVSKRSNKLSAASCIMHEQSI